MSPTTSDGAPAGQLIADALALFPSEISYVRAEVGRPGHLVPVGASAEDGEWISCGELTAHPAWLESVIRASGTSLGTRDPVVAGSLFVQNYSYRVLMAAIACMTTASVVPDSAAPAMAVSISKGRPSAVSYAEPAAFVLGHRHEEPVAVLGDQTVADEALTFLFERAVDGHLAPLIEAVRARVRVGRRLLWGNVAASAAVAFRTMDGCLGSWVRPLGERFFALSPAPLRGLGSFLALEHEGRQGWYWERTNCCLYDRLPGEVRCADCSRTPPAGRRAAYLESLRAG